MKLKSNKEMAVRASLHNLINEAKEQQINKWYFQDFLPVVFRLELVVLDAADEGEGRPLVARVHGTHPVGVVGAHVVSELAFHCTSPGFVRRLTFPRLNNKNKPLNMTTPTEKCWK